MRLEESMSNHAEEHAHPNYVQIWAVLVALLVVSVVGPMLGIKVVTLITAFGIAMVKAYLVVKNFMHVNLEPKLIGALMVTTLSIMVMMFFLVAPDVMKHEGQNWVNVAAGNDSSGAAAHTTKDAEEPTSFDAKETFSTLCAACHGAGGDGSGAAAAALNPKPADFTQAEFWQTRDRESILIVIRDGGVAVGKSPLMAAYGGMYDAEQIDALVDVVLDFKP